MSSASQDSRTCDTRLSYFLGWTARRQNQKNFSQDIIIHYSAICRQVVIDVWSGVDSCRCDPGFPRALGDLAVFLCPILAHAYRLGLNVTRESSDECGTENLGN